MRRLWHMLRNPYSGPATYTFPRGAVLYVDAALSNIPLPRFHWCRCDGCKYIAFDFGDGNSDPIFSIEIAARDELL